MKWYTIGPLSFPASWAAIGTAFLLTSLYFVIQRKKAVADDMGNAFFIFFLIWKLSVILLQFSTVIKNPLMILYFNGGWKGYALGMAGAFIYLCVKVLQNRLNSSLLVEAWMFSVLVYELAFYLLNARHILMGSIHILGAILFFLWTRKKAGQTIWQLQLLILFTCFQAFIYSFKGDMLSAPMATYVAACGALAATILTERKRADE